MNEIHSNAFTIELNQLSRIQFIQLRSGQGTIVESAESEIQQAEVLAMQSRAGCMASFEELVNLFEKRIYKFLHQYVRNAHDAEDLTQETFLKAYRNIHRYDSSYRFATWLYTIAKRCAASHLRSRRPTEELQEEISTGAQSPLDDAGSRDEQGALWAEARKLKPGQFEALWLKYGEGFSIAETAQVMGKTQIHVKVLLHRARLNLAKRIGVKRKGWLGG